MILNATKQYITHQTVTFSNLTWTHSQTVSYLFFKASKSNFIRLSNSRTPEGDPYSINGCEISKSDSQRDLSIIFLRTCYGPATMTILLIKLIESLHGYQVPRSRDTDGLVNCKCCGSGVLELSVHFLPNIEGVTFKKYIFFWQWLAEIERMP